jgi:8-oxo-dGTP pyrophosphatase MutT (NUDIX family)
VTGDARRERVRAALLAHAAADAAEERALRAMLAALDAPADPFDRTALPAHFTASAIILARDGDAVLLVWHRRLGRWLQPGGHVQAEDASLLDTASREAREETGVDRLAAPLGEVILHVDAHDIPARPGEPAHVHLDVRYLLVAPTTAPSAADAGVREAGWFAPHALPALALDDSLRRALGRARAARPSPSRGGSGNTRR